jgi:hypothetical protein
MSASGCRLNRSTQPRRQISRLGFQIARSDSFIDDNWNIEQVINNCAYAIQFDITYRLMIKEGICTFPQNWSPKHPIVPE